MVLLALGSLAGAATSLRLCSGLAGRCMGRRSRRLSRAMMAVNAGVWFLPLVLFLPLFVLVFVPEFGR